MTPVSADTPAQCYRAVLYCQVFFPVQANVVDIYVTISLTLDILTLQSCALEIYTLDLLTLQLSAIEIYTLDILTLKSSALL